MFKKSFAFGLFGGMDFLSFRPASSMGKFLQGERLKSISRISSELSLPLVRLGYVCHWLLIYSFHFWICRKAENSGVPTLCVFIYFWLFISASHYVSALIFELAKKYEIIKVNP